MIDQMRRSAFLCEFCEVAGNPEIFEGSYAKYMRSERWASLRAAALSRAGNRCQVCNSDLLLQVHHRKYPERLEWEDPMDLTVLCRRCHDLFHNVRGER